MALVRIDPGLAERGIAGMPPQAPEEPTAPAPPDASQLEALHAQIAYQAELIAELQAALRSVLAELQRRDARALAAFPSPSGAARVARRARAASAPPKAPAPAPAPAPPPAPEE